MQVNKISNPQALQDWTPHHQLAFLFFLIFEPAEDAPKEAGSIFMKTQQQIIYRYREREREKERERERERKT